MSQHDFLEGREGLGGLRTRTLNLRKKDGQLLILICHECHLEGVTAEHSWNHSLEVKSKTKGRMGQERARSLWPYIDLNDTFVSLEVSMPSSPGFPSLTSLRKPSTWFGARQVPGQLDSVGSSLGREGPDYVPVLQHR